MIIGLDFDNTIVNYERVFYQTALSLGWLTDESVGTSKEAVKTWFIKNDNEPKWTELQGIVYGKTITDAQIYPGCLDMIATWQQLGHKLYIVSHKTRYPIIGDKLDFHHAALDWMQEKLFQHVQLTAEQVYFCPSIDDKIATLSHLNCSAFVDDLPKVLGHKHFPDTCYPVLFDPEEHHLQHVNLNRVSTWHDISLP